MFDTGFVQQNAKPVLGGEFMSSFVLGVTRDGRALLTLEKRGNETKLAIPGGKAMAGENSFATAARGAHEESGGALSEMTRLRIARGAGVRGQVEFNSAIAVLHDLVVPADNDVELRFDKQEATRLRAASEKAAVQHTIGKKKRPTRKKATEQLDLVFVSLADLRSQQWREKSMFSFPHSVLAARLMKLICPK